MNDKLKAKEILDYCIDYLLDGGQTLDAEFPKNKKEVKLYKEMLKEINFMLTTD
jgi:hypothetical protein